MSVDDALKYVDLDGRRAAPRHAGAAGRAAAALPGPRRSPRVERPPKLTGSAGRRAQLRQPAARHRRSPPAPPVSAPSRTNTSGELAVKRTDYCGRIDRRFLDQTVTLTGWVHRRRDHGGVIFIDLRDREGLVQVVCDPDRAETFATAETLRNEYCVAVTGRGAPAPRGHGQRRTWSPARSRCSRTRSRSSTPR